MPTKKTLSIAELANDQATGDLDYRGHKIEFEFNPAAYTGGMATAPGLTWTQLVATCVTSWNIDCELNVEALAPLPEGLMKAVAVAVMRLSTDANLGEASTTSPPG